MVGEAVRFCVADRCAARPCLEGNSLRAASTRNEAAPPETGTGGLQPTAATFAQTVAAKQPARSAASQPGGAHVDHRSETGGPET